jgi:hypothetical protein
MLTLGTNANPADTNYAAWISRFGTKAQNDMNSMLVFAGRTYLFNQETHLDTVSSDITGTYGQLRDMAMGYSLHGSIVETNTTLRARIIDGLDWMYTNYYNERITNEYDNWFDWQIGAALNLNDITVLMYNDLTPAQRDHAGLHHFADAVWLQHLEHGVELGWRACDLDAERLRPDIDHLRMEQLGGLDDPMPGVVVCAHFHKEQLALHRLVFLELDDLQHIDELVQLLRHLLENAALDADDDRHARELRMLGRADC